MTAVTENQKLSYIDFPKKWTKNLLKIQFIQIHKSYIIYTNFVVKISGNILFVKSNKTQIGRTYKHELMAKLGM